jgi:hypothetical protein
MMRDRIAVAVVAAAVLILSVFVVAGGPVSANPPTCKPAGHFACPTPTPTPTPTPGCAGLIVNPADNLQALINANASGSTFCLQTGVNRSTPYGGFAPKSGDIIQGAGQTAVVSGAKILTGWVASGSNFVVTGFLGAVSPAVGTCDPAFPLCQQAEDIWLDGNWLQPVAGVAALAPGRAFLDYPNNRIYIRDNPTGHLLEQNWARRLFGGSATNVQIRNLNIQGAASTGNTGVLDPSSGGTGWVLDHNDISRNHGYGTGPGASGGMTITANRVHNNGQDGTGADAGSNLIQGNEVYGNSYAGWSANYDAGNKFGHAVNLQVIGNYYHDERGPGIWCDINCNNITIANNYVSNSATGIMFEISCGASIHDNTVVNGNNDNSHADGASVFISNSRDAEVYANHIYDGQRGIWAWNVNRTEATTTACPEHLVRNLNVHDNDVGLNGAASPYGGKVGLWTDQQRTDLYTTLGNGFVHNTYHDTTPSPEWAWNVCGTYSCVISFGSWQAAGEDTAGSLAADNPTPPAPPTLVVGPQP